ncbi:MAG: M16 family metallopeptidase, partial [Spirochaetota bacterium]
LRYYIRANSRPAQRAELRLVVNAGSVLEDQDQRGLAHFLEHMAFEGTKNFEKDQIVDYLESIGMRYGPDLNAYTTYDETVYFLQVPTDDREALATGVQILEDWAHNMSLDKEAIDKERRIIVEEWRLRRSALARMRDEHYPVLFKGSRYARRRPIGKMEVIKNFDPEVLRRFYRDWYRPDLMTVIAVGDFNPEMMEKLIRKHFSEISMPEDPRPKPHYGLPGHHKTLFSVASDPEATGSLVRMIAKHSVRPFSTVQHYREHLKGALFNSMLTARLDELAHQSHSPLLGGFSAMGRIIRPSEFFFLSAQVKDNGIAKGLEALLTEALRVKKYGFSPSELSREKKALLKGIEQSYKERDKMQSSRFAAEYSRNFLEDEPIPGIAYEYRIYHQFVPGITLEEVNRIAERWLTDENRVVLANSPRKPGIEVPEAKELAAVFRKMEDKEVSPYQDMAADLPLVPGSPEPGRVVEETHIPELGVTEWTLSNGVQVVLKPTDFQNDQVLFNSFSPGGHSLAPDENHVPAITAADLIDESGVGNFNFIQLHKKLAGKAVDVSPWIDRDFEGIDGSSTPEDLETMFQLIYLYFTQPRLDRSAFLKFQEKLKNEVANRKDSPERVFRDTVTRALTQDHPRARPWSMEMVEELDMESSFQFYQERFSDAGDFTFFLVGNFQPQTIKKLVETYIGGLPSTGRKEKWRDLGIDPPQGIVKRTVTMGIDPKSLSQIVFNGPFRWSWDAAVSLDVLAEVLDIILREALREEQSGTYSVWAQAVPSHYPDSEYRVYMGFGSSPRQAQKLGELALQEAQRLREEGPEKTIVNKVKEILKRERETNLEENEFWASVLRSYYLHHWDPLLILKYTDFIQKMSSKEVKEAAKNYLDPDRYVHVVLLPEKEESNTSDQETEMLGE